MSRGVWGVDIRSLDTGEHLYDLNAGRLMMPASNMKIVTLAAAADILGWDYRFTTTLDTTGTVEGGVLKGDLIVRGGGDPTINTREGRAAARLDEWAAALRAAGIQQIDGAVIGDDQHFDDEGIGAGWAWDYLQFGYAAPVGALQFNENLATLTVTPGLEAGAPATVALTAGSGLRTMTRVGTGGGRRSRGHRLPPAPRSACARGQRNDRRGIGAARTNGGGRQPDHLLRAVAQGRADRTRDRGQR